MPIKIRRQALSTPYKRASVTIVSIDQFLKEARKLNKYSTEKEHLKIVLSATVIFPYYFTLAPNLDVAFWVKEK